jgi:tetratricopeptide (TPR) repeat protein
MAMGFDKSLVGKLKIDEEEGFDPEIQQHVDEYIESIVEGEKELYHNDLVPFAQYAKEIKAKVSNTLHEIQKRLEKGREILKKQLELEESKDPTIVPELRFSAFEEIAAKMQEKCESTNYSLTTFNPFIPLQDEWGVSKEFVARAYTVARQLLIEKNYEDALAAFTVLRYLNPQIYEFLLGEATALHELGKIEEAYFLYNVCLGIQPTNPYLFYQISNCLHQLHEVAASLEAIKVCIGYAEKDENSKELLQSALDIKRSLELQKAA